MTDYLHTTEFGPEFAIETQVLHALEASGFEDDSWHNDICPSFVRACTFHDRPDGTVVKIWVDAADPADRELESTRYMVAAYNECEPVTDAYETDRLGAALDHAHAILAAHEA